MCSRKGKGVGGGEGRGGQAVTRIFKKDFQGSIFFLGGGEGERGVKDFQVAPTYKGNCTMEYKHTNFSFPLPRPRFIYMVQRKGFLVLLGGRRRVKVLDHLITINKCC